MTNKLSKTEITIFIALSALIWIYLWLRAYYIPLIHDEAATFFHYIHPESWLPYKAHLDANNHFLNSALAIVSYRIFGSSMLAIRLPNLLFALVFFFYTYKISTQINSRILRWVFIGSLLTASYFIEFFALARGYGISMALLIASLYYLILVFKENKSVNYFATLIILTLAISANLTLLNSAIIINVLLLIKALWNFKNDKLKAILSKLFFVIVLGIIPLAFFAAFSFKLRESGSLYYGDNIGFWESTVRTLIKAFAGGNSMFSEIIIVFLFVFSTLIFIIRIFRTKLTETLNDFRIIFPILLIGNLCAILILSGLFEVNYPEDRVALYLFPLLIGSLVFAFDKIENQRIKIAGLISLFPLLFLLIHSISNLNLSYSSYWKSEHLPESFYKIVEKESIGKEINPTIGGYLMRELCWNYWDFRHGGKLNKIQTLDYPGNIADFQISDKDSLPKFLDNYYVLETDDYSKLSLLKRKNDLQKTSLISLYNISTKGETNTEFFGFYESNTDTLIGKKFLISYDLSVFSKVKSFDAFIIISVIDKDRNSLQYIYYSLYRAKTYWTGEKSNLKICLYVPELSRESSLLTTYLWNVNQVPFEIKDGSCEVFELK
ncbi:MAG: glycosyltransferase family 39 protein [Saprospiraceae bacterium]|nr:glycosyltransferase family 39 protein [Saprospiraceae bacterium]